MKIFTAVVHPNGFFINADTQSDFWVLLSKTLGWGKFCFVRGSREFTENGGLFELRELRQASEPAPSPIVSDSNVLWRLPEALEVLKQYSPSQVPEDWKAQ